MRKEITLPETYEDITLNQFQRYDLLNKREDLDELGYNKRLIEIFTDLKHREIGRIPHKDYGDILKQIIEAMNKEAKFQNRFFIRDVEFGFIPNLDKVSPDEVEALSTGVYVDGIANVGDVQDYHKLMAVLFRPILTKRIKNNKLKRVFGASKYYEVKSLDKFGNYEIESYKGTRKYEEVMKLMPMHIVNGAFVFFYHLSKELREHTQRYTNQVQAKVDRLQTILKSGDGMRPSAN